MHGPFGEDCVAFIIGIVPAKSNRFCLCRSEIKNGKPSCYDLPFIPEQDTGLGPAAYCLINLFKFGDFT